MVTALRNRYFYIITFLLVACSENFSQTVYQPVYYSNVYEFLDRMSIEGIIKFKDELRPLPRETIAKKLIELENQSDALTNVEKEWLRFYKSEFYYEVNEIKSDTTHIEDYFDFNPKGRFNFFSYYDKNFSITVDPIVGLGYSSLKHVYHQFSGISFWGKIGNNWGYYFNYRDNYERSNNLDRKKLFSPETGIIISKGDKNSIQYSEVRGGLVYTWKWGDISMAKDFINIGSSYNSQVILSSKAPSFPFIRLDISPIKWLRFTYFHGWLNSGLIDSSTISSTGINFTNREYTYSRIEKFIALHMLSFDIDKNFTFSVGESIIYGNKLEVLYLMPVMFYRLADHYLSKDGSDTGDNAQIFLNAYFKVPSINSKFYSTLYIDEMSPSKFFHKDGSLYQTFAYQLGGLFIDPVWSNSTINLEYTHIDPYSYMNENRLNQFYNEQYQLGHWIGSNADQILFSLSQYFHQKITLNLKYRFIRKGGKEDITLHPDFSTRRFLYGGVNYYSSFELGFVYNPLNYLYLNLSFESILKSTGRFISEYKINKGNSFNFKINYGL